LRLNPIIRIWRALPVPRNLRADLSPAINKILITLLSARRLPRRQSLDDTPAGPLVVSGLLSSVLGISSGARATVVGLREAGMPPVIHDISVLQSAPLYARFDLPVTEGGGVWLTHCNGPELERLFWGLPRRAIEHRWRIGYWAWELDILPESWIRPARLLHEIWTPSRFVADTVKAALGDDGPIVRVMPHPSRDLSAVRADRGRFGLPPDALIVLTMFDTRSTFARKNPDAAIDAYLAAFPEPGNQVLVCKVVAADKAAARLEALKARTAHRPDIVLMTEELTDEMVWTLIASADIVLSLHRSEGYGLVLAEAMQLSRVVIATGWSGNMDFMDDACSAPVPYALTPVEDSTGQYQVKGARWADPDVGAAARALQSLAADPRRREAMGRAARTRILEHEAGFGRAIAEMPWRDKALS
jgi:glycosyltransferase involved in cell wall biosynthesis